MEINDTSPRPSPQSGEGETMPALCRVAATQKRPLTAHSRGRGKWDCVRQMEMYRQRPDVLAAALRDMGVLPDGHYEDEPHEQCEPHGPSDDDQCEPHGPLSNN